MSTTKAVKAGRRKEAKQLLSFATRRSLATKAAPALTAMLTPMSEELLVFRRVHLPALARQGGKIPQPLTESVVMLFNEGRDKVLEEHGAERHDQMAAALIRACALQVPESEEITKALAEAQALIEDESWKDEKADQQTLRAIEAAARGLAGDDAEGGVGRAAAVIARKARTRLVSDGVQAKMQERGREAMRIIEDALAGLTASELEPLFVAPGEEPGPGQMVLAVGPEEVDSHDPDDVVIMHPADLRAGLLHVFTNGPYAHRQFRR